MAFTVETGSIVTGANSLVSLADADAYHSDRANASWDGSDEVRQAALVKATDYIQQKYTGCWKGELIRYDQPLDWPRQGITDGVLTIQYNEIPARLKAAVCELALEALTGTLNPTLARGGLVKREKVDVIEVEYMDGASGTTKRPAIDGLLKPFLLFSSAINAKAIRV
jgi:hypothetical protein